MKLLMMLLGASLAAQAHDVITTPITWSREISRIVYQRCATCHHDGGSAFPLMTYSDVRPWAEAIKEEVLSRRMPPWGAVKGFGEFRNDRALTAEQLELIGSWANGGVPEGDAKDLPALPADDNIYRTDAPSGGIAVSGEFKLDKPIVVDGLFPKTASKSISLQMNAELPDGRVEPLLWLSDYQSRFKHSFLLRRPLELPAGTIIRGVPSDATVLLLPVTINDLPDVPTKSGGE
jgi:mono/diheme cytochrome c family protein